MIILSDTKDSIFEYKRYCILDEYIQQFFDDMSGNDLLAEELKALFLQLSSKEVFEASNISYEMKNSFIREYFRESGTGFIVEHLNGPFPSVRRPYDDEKDKASHSALELKAIATKRVKYFEELSSDINHEEETKNLMNALGINQNESFC